MCICDKRSNNRPNRIIIKKTAIFSDWVNLAFVEKFAWLVSLLCCCSCVCLHVCQCSVLYIPCCLSMNDKVDKGVRPTSFFFPPFWAPSCGNYVNILRCPRRRTATREHSSFPHAVGRCSKTDVWSVLVHVKDVKKAYAIYAVRCHSGQKP